MKKKLFLLILFMGWTFMVLAQLTIKVTSVPANTPQDAQIYIAGNFNNWNPGNPDHILSKNPDGTFQITLNIPAMQLRFKFTRGSWESVEGNAGGGFLPDRVYSYTGGPQQHQVVIAGWEGQNGSNGTAAPNVRVHAQNFFIPQLNRTRRIWVYLPPDYFSSEKHYPVLYMHDGQNVFDAATSFSGEWRVDESLNALFENGDDGIIVVAIDNGGGNRINEYSPWVNPQYGGGQGEEYVDFIIETLKPHIDSTFRTRPERDFTGMMGSSLGGLISLYAGIEHQEVFSKLGIFSPAFWFSPQCYDHASSAGKKAGMKIYLLAGQLEGNGSVVTDVRSMYNTLLQAGFSSDELIVDIDPDGQHSEWYWAREFPGAYEWLFAETTTTGSGALSWTAHFSVLPNPADSLLRFEGISTLNSPAVVLYTPHGQTVLSYMTIQNGSVDVSALSPGVYIVQLFSGTVPVGSRKVVIYHK